MLLTSEGAAFLESRYFFGAPSHQIVVYKSVYFLMGNSCGHLIRAAKLDRYNPTGLSTEIEK